MLSTLKESVSCVKEWRVPNYRLVDPKYTQGERFKSDSFTLGRAKWSFALCPNGLSGEGDNNVSFLLVLETEQCPQDGDRRVRLRRRGGRPSHSPEVEDGALFLLWPFRRPQGISLSIDTGTAAATLPSGVLVLSTKTTGCPSRDRGRTM